MRWTIAGLIAAIGAIALYLASAAISVDRLVQAARAGNAAEVVKRTDMDRLRRSLVDQIIAAYLERIGKIDRPLERLVVRTYGATIADAMLQKMLGADNLTKLLQTGTISGAGVPTSLVPNVLSIDISGGWCADWTCNLGETGGIFHPDQQGDGARRQFRGELPF